MNETNPSLGSFLASGKKLAEGEFKWGDIPIKVTCSLSSEPAPSQYISSVRAIMFRGDEVLVCTDRPQHQMIIPGGRCEKGESPLDTLRRELLEETGWTLKNPQLLGFMHMHHLGPKPAEYKYLYPDFIQPIYIAEAGSHIPEAIQKDDYVASSRFYAVPEAMTLNIEPGELELLKAAVELRKKLFS